MKSLPMLKWAATLAAAALVASCGAYQPYDYHNEREKMQGPGLFSGPDGVFTIYGPQSSPAPQGGADPDKRPKEDEDKAIEADP